MEEEEWRSALFGGLPPLLLKDVTFVLSKFVVFDIVKTAILAYHPEARDSLSSTLLVSLCRCSPLYFASLPLLVCPSSSVRSALIAPELRVNSALVESDSAGAL